MSDWPRDTNPELSHPAGDPGVFQTPADPAARPPLRAATPGASCVTPAGAEWLASACSLPASVHALWAHRPASPSRLPCGVVFDVVSAAPLPGRLILERLWATGPGSGPVAVHRGRILLFAAPGTAQRLPALLSWEEWREPPRPRPAPAAASFRAAASSSGAAAGGTTPGTPRAGTPRSARSVTAETFPSLLCLGPGDLVGIPALHGPHPDEHPEGQPLADEQPHPDRQPQPDRQPRPAASRWLVAPDVRHPWLPGPEVLLRACVRPYRDHLARRTRAGVRAGRKPAGPGRPISGTADGDARVYDVTKRR